jgi:hypothetical protein
MYEEPDRPAPVFVIQAMDGEEMRAWNSRLSIQLREATRNAPNNLRVGEEVEAKNQDECFIDRIVRIENAAAWAAGITSDHAKLHFIGTMPKNDYQWLDRVLWDISVLLASEVKNSECSPPLPSTKRDEPNTDAKVVKESPVLKNPEPATLPFQGKREPDKPTS